MTETTRRALLGGAAAVAGAAALGPLDALAARSAEAHGGSGPRRPFSPDYGPLSPVRDHTTGLPLLLLPKGFEYISYGWTGDRMSDGAPTPSAHDGMAAFKVSKGHGHRWHHRDRVHLVRNHEVSGFSEGRFTDPAYDPDA